MHLGAETRSDCDSAHPSREAAASGCTCLMMAAWLMMPSASPSAPNPLFRKLDLVPAAMGRVDLSFIEPISCLPALARPRKSPFKLRSGALPLFYWTLVLWCLGVGLTLLEGSCLMLVLGDVAA
jgi:hypothetical protein